MVSKSEEMIKTLKNDFEFLKNDVDGILLYGSHAKNSADEHSDIDICIIKPYSKDVLNRIFQKSGNKYDIKIFEDLPLYIQIGIIKDYIIIFGDEPSISYYFYRFRKRWEDMRHRIQSNRFETVSEMNALRRKWLERRR